MLKATSIFYQVSKCHFHTTINTQINCHRASIGKIGRKIYTRLYPTVLVNSNGSTINIRYHEPRKIIKLPLDIRTLTEEQRKAMLNKRKPKTKILIEEEVEDSFDLDNYKHLWSK